MLTQAMLKEQLNYDQQTGIWIWIISRKGVTKGSMAGQIDRYGYRNINVNYKRYISSRLAFLYMTGSFPIHDCDHIDGNPGNDRWDNLREATTTQNLQNKRVQSNNKIGLKGIHPMKVSSQNKYRARIKANETHIHLGVFDCPAAARLAYVIAADTYFGEFARQ